MTTAPASLLAVRDVLARHTGLSAVSLGIVGDGRHRSGYHLGRDRIYSILGFGDADYSVQTARDRAGLTNAASAIDIGRFDRLRSFSVWLVEQCRAGRADTLDIREIFYSPDGVTTLWWDRERGMSSAPRVWPSSPHTDHTHVSYYRNATGDLAAVYRRYFAGGSATDMLAVVTRTPFPAPVPFLTRPGSRLVGYDPARPNTLVVDRTWSVASLAHADAVVSVSWPGVANAPVPRGGPFLAVIDGVYAGLLIVAGLVDWLAPTSPDYRDGYNDALAAVSLEIDMLRKAGE